MTTKSIQDFQQVCQFIAYLNVSSLPPNCQVKKMVMQVGLTFSETGPTEGHCDWHRCFQIPIGEICAIIDLYVYGSREYYEQVSDFFWTFCLNSVKNKNFSTYLFYSGTNGFRNGEDDRRFFEDLTEDNTRYYIAVETEKEMAEIVNMVSNNQLVAR